MHPRVLASVAVGSLLIAVASLTLVVWIAAAPHYWFPTAFAPEGAQGPPGVRGHQGPAGVAGPVGPDAQGAIDDLTSRLDDLETGTGDQAQQSVDDIASATDNLQSTVEDLATGTGSSAGTSVLDVADRLDSLCSAISTNDVYDISEAFGSFISDLDSAC
jgi:hypothetical protein